MTVCVSNPAVLLPLSAPSAASTAALRDLAGLPDIDEPDIRGHTLQTSPVVPGPIGDDDTLQFSVLPGRHVHKPVHPALPQASAASCHPARPAGPLHHHAGSHRPVPLPADHRPDPQTPAPPRPSAGSNCALRDPPHRSAARDPRHPVPAGWP